jgi:hypothetical protein
MKKEALILEIAAILDGERYFFERGQPKNMFH